MCFFPAQNTEKKEGYNLECSYVLQSPPVVCMNVHSYSQFIPPFLYKKHCPCMTNSFYRSLSSLLIAATMSYNEESHSCMTLTQPFIKH